MSEVVEVWFQLRDQMLQKPEHATAVRPPSLRDACYAWALSVRSKNDTDPSTIEAYVNGLELGALHALREAWEARKR